MAHVQNKLSMVAGGEGTQYIKFQYWHETRVPSYQYYIIWV